MRSKNNTGARMKMYTYSKARENFAEVLNEADQYGEVTIRRKDGKLFVIKPLKNNTKSPFDVEAVESNLSREDIIQAVRESRER